MHKWKAWNNGLVLLLKTVILRWHYKFLYAIKDDEDGNGLKFEKNLPVFFKISPYALKNHQQNYYG